MLFRFLCVFMLSCVVVSPTDVFSCGPFFTTAIYVQRWAPDYPLEAYYAGRVGIVQRTYPMAYLFAAYRYFSGKPLTAKEQEVFGRSRGPSEIQETPSPAYDRWVEVRRQVLGSEPPQYPVDVSFQDEKRNLYVFYRNIHDDAFEGAAKTLRERVAQFGAQSPLVVQFAQTQDDVFMSAQTGQVPSGLDSSAPALFRSDRAYQVAAAFFYGRQFGKSESLFTIIGNDRTSPWSKLSRYLVARVMIRNATLLAMNQDSVLKEAEHYLRGQLQDTDMRELHPSMERLLGFCMFRTSPAELFRQLDRKFSGSDVSSLTSEEWQNYADLMHEIGDSSSTQYSDFDQWWACYTRRWKAPTYIDALKKYRATKSDAWLVAALSLADPYSKGVTELLHHAKSISRKKPAYATGSYWRAELLVDRNNLKQARALLNDMIARPEVPESRSNINLLRALRLETAVNLTQFLMDCHQKLADTEWGKDSSPQTDSLSRFTPGAIIVDTKFPVRVMLSASRNRSLPENLRRALLQAAWVRSVLIGQDSIAVEAARALEKVDGQLTPLLKEYVSSEDSTARQFTAAYILLKNPGLRPSIRIGVDRLTKLASLDEYRDNWWDNGKWAILDNLSHNWQGYRDADPYDFFPERRPSFLSVSDTAIAHRETSILAGLPPAATYLGKIATDWAQAHPDDKRIPEALHRAVQVSRYGCADRGSREFSKKAFKILHRRYATSPWTAKTKYWY